jgi:hypothetical protein
MKSLKQLLLLGLSIMFLLTTSCTIEKRVYMSGYHIKWNKSKQIPDRQELASYDKENKTKQNEIVTVEQSENKMITVDNTAIMSDETIAESADDEQIILPQKENINLFSSHKITDKENEIKPSTKKEFKKGNKTTSLNTDDEREMSAMAIAGFICGVLGLLLAIATGWSFLLGILGVIFSAIGLSQTSKGKKGKGFAIAGLTTGILAIAIFWVVIAIISSLLL